MSSFSDSWLKPGHPISWLTKVKPISYTTFRDHLSKSLRSVVPDASVYGTHSFRSGELPKLPIAVHVGEQVFQRHGRWKSVSAKDGYAKDNITSRISDFRTLASSVHYSSSLFVFY